MNVLLVSTYDLGRQPFGLASPAAWLAGAGFDVRCLDLAVQPLDEDAVRAAGLIAFHLPMHTATRLALHLLPKVRALNPGARLCAYGLYAPMNEAGLRARGVEVVVGGEFEAALVEVARAAAAGRRAEVPAVSLERLAFRVPERGGLPPHVCYAGLATGEGAPLLVGYTEASRGCKHLCRHCPVVPVYQGRFRVVAREVVLEDIRRQVAAGVRHVTFGDPDFFNGIGHALPLVRALHAEHPGVSYDVTIKVEHLLKHRAHLPLLRDTGCRFVTTAVESVDDAVLERLRKGHTRADFVEVAGRFRELGLCLHPTFVAFHPWTTVASYLDMLATLEGLDLVEHVSPIQLALRLLVPAGSALLELDEVRAMVGAFDAAALCHPWRHADPAVDALQRRLEARMQEPGTRREAFDDAWRMAVETPGAVQPERRAAARRPKRAPVPFLTEPWYC